MKDKQALDLWKRGLISDKTMKENVKSIDWKKEERLIKKEVGSIFDKKLKKGGIK